MDKVLRHNEICTKIASGHTLMIGGFGLVGCPLTLIHEIENSQLDQLTIISNNLGEPGKGLGRLVTRKKVSKGIGSFFTSNPEVVHAYLDNELAIDLIPQGTLSESIRAGGAGIGGFYIKTGIGTKMAEGKETRIIKGEEYLYQESLTADVALVRAYKADRLGNLIYKKSARNFNPIMASAAKIVIAEVDEIVEIGELSAEEIVTPHLFVDFIVLTGGDLLES